VEAVAISALVEAVPGVSTVPRRALFVGAFPPAGTAVLGGMVTSCRILLSSSFSSRVNLDLLDSTQISNPPPALPVRCVRAARRFVRFVNRFERGRPEVVLLFVAVGASIVEKGAMSWYARLRGVPVIMFPRGGSVIDDCRRSAFTRAWVRVFFRGARKIVCQSESWRRFAVDVLGFGSLQVAVIRNWTATRDLLDIGAKRAVRQEGAVRLLFLGWLERDKGIFELLNACRQLSTTLLFSLDIAGEGNASAEARAVVDRHKLTDMVHFRGWLRDEALHQALRDADVLVLPSWAEGLPNAMIEAMAAGLAVVVTSVGAIPELITDRRSGMLVEPRSADSLAGALNEVINNRELCSKLAREGYRIAVREFEVEAAADRLIAEIEDTIIHKQHARVKSARPQRKGF
jgi:glycosyltransferase involved in cell wall biosynthesis